MSQIAAASISSARAVQIVGADWRTYMRLLRIFAEHPGVRLAYDRGDLEIMSPSLEHDDGGDFLGWLVCAIAEELHLPLKNGGSVTLRSRKRRRGIEPDRCFWIANALQMTGKKRLDLRRDPPPDLAIEIGVSHSSLDRLSIYAALRVPEVWRLEGSVLSFYVLGEVGYANGPTSLAFPFLTPGDLMPFVIQASEAGDETAVIRTFREWLRIRVARNS